MERIDEIGLLRIIGGEQGGDTPWNSTQSGSQSSTATNCEPMSGFSNVSRGAREEIHADHLDEEALLGLWEPRHGENWRRFLYLSKTPWDDNLVSLHLGFKLGDGQCSTCQRKESQRSGAALVKSPGILGTSE